MRALIAPVAWVVGEASPKLATPRVVGQRSCFRLRAPFLPIAPRRRPRAAVAATVESAGCRQPGWPTTLFLPRRSVLSSASSPIAMSRPLGCAPAGPWPEERTGAVVQRAGVAPVSNGAAVPCARPRRGVVPPAAPRSRWRESSQRLGLRFDMSSGRRARSAPRRAFDHLGRRLQCATSSFRTLARGPPSSPAVSVTGRWRVAGPGQSGRRACRRQPPSGDRVPPVFTPGHRPGGALPLRPTTSSSARQLSTCVSCASARGRDPSMCHASHSAGPDVDATCRAGPPSRSRGTDGPAAVRLLRPAPLRGSRM